MTDYTFKYNESGCLALKARRSQVKSEILKMYTSSVSIYVCDFPFYVGPIPAEVIRCNARFESWVSSNYQRFTSAELKSLASPRMVVSGGWITASSILKEYALPPKFPDKNANFYLDLVAQEGYPFLRLPQMRKPKIEDLDHVRINPESKPGFFTSMFFGAKKKESVGYSLQVAKHFYRKLTSEGKRNGRMIKYTGIWEIGGRAKEVKCFGKPHTDAATRLVWMGEEWLTLIASSIIQPYVQTLKHIPRSCIFVGKDFTQGVESWIENLQHQYTFSLQTDWKHFDAYHTPEIIKAAAQLFAWCYPQDHETQRLLAFLTDTIIDKNVVIPPGIVLNIKKGMPSGHPMMAIFNSLCNYIALVEIMSHVYGKGNVGAKCYILSSGDDAIIYFNDLKPMLQIDKVIKNVCEYVSSEPFVANIRYNRATDIDLQSLFLKRSLHPNGIIGWSTPKMLRKFLRREKADYSFLAEITWVSNQVFTAPGDGRLMTLLIDYLCSRIDDIDVPTQFNSKSAITDHVRTFYEEGIKFRTRQPYFVYREFSTGKEINSKHIGWYETIPAYMVRAQSGSTEQNEVLYPYGEFCGLLTTFTGSADESWGVLNDKLMSLATADKLGDFPFTPGLRSRIKSQYQTLVNGLSAYFKMSELGLPKHPKLMTRAEMDWFESIMVFLLNEDNSIPSTVAEACKNYVRNHQKYRKRFKEDDPP